MWLRWAAQPHYSGAVTEGRGAGRERPRPRSETQPGSPSGARSPHPDPTTTPPPSFSPRPVVWVGVWFLGFCFLANQWQHSPPKQFLLGSSSAKAAITFAFFSILIWVRTGPSAGTLHGAGVGATASAPSLSSPAPAAPP